MCLFCQALLRPGRFDRHIMIDYPTLSERKEIFNMYLRQLKLAKVPESYVDRLAQLTPGMTGSVVIASLITHFAPVIACL